MLSAITAVTLLVAMRKGHATFDLLAESTAVQPGKPFWVAMRFRIDPGWHIYWKNPGDSGVTTSVTLTLPPGFTADETKWPGPKQFKDGEIVNYGYSDEAVLLAQIRPPKNLKPASRIAISAKASWMACQEMCVMGTGSGSVNLEAGKVPKPKADFARFRALVPVAGIVPTATFRGQSIDLTWNWKGGVPPSMYFYPETPNVVQAGAPQTPLKNRRSESLGLRLAAVEGARPPENLAGVLEIVYSSNKRAFFVVSAPCKRAD